MPLNSIFWCTSFGRQFVTRPVIWKEINGEWRWGFSYGSFPLFYFYFYECRRVYSRGAPTSLIKGAVFSSQLCVFVAEPLLLKCNHSNLPPWFPIERISSPSLPEWNLWLFGISHPLPLPGCLQTADTGFSVLHVVGIFSGLQLLLSNKTD